MSARAYAGCQIVGDQFLAWGGGDDKEVVLSAAPPSIFDLTTKQWVGNYTAPSYYQTASPPGGTGTTSESSNLGAILGGVIGSLVVIGLAVAFYFYRDSRLSANLGRKEEIPMAQDGVSKDYAEDILSDGAYGRIPGPQWIEPGKGDVGGYQHLPGPQGLIAPQPPYNDGYRIFNPQ